VTDPRDRGQIVGAPAPPAPRERASEQGAHARGGNQGERAATEQREEATTCQRHRQEDITRSALAAVQGVLVVTITRDARAAYYRRVLGRGYLGLVVLIAGFGTLGLELTALSLFAPYFGVSQPVWASVIGATLLYLAVGYVLGGRLADRRPSLTTLCSLVALAGAAAGLIPLGSRPLLGWAAQHARDAGLLGALAGMLMLFALPTILLAAISPLAIRLALPSVERAGRTAGRLYALSTAGSLLGAFVPSLVLVPLLGTRRTLAVISLALLAVALPGLLRGRRAPALLLLLALGLDLWSLRAAPPIKPTMAGDAVELVHEEESAYNYLRVTRHPDPEGGSTYLLELNEGSGAHSVYHDRYARTEKVDDLLTGQYWDYPGLSAFFYPERAPASVRSLLMIGLGAGTASAIFLGLFGPQAQVDGVEIDPRIVEAGRRWFGLREGAGLRVHIADGRAFLNQLQGRYDVIGVDVYRWPYVAAHVVTQEAFERMREHLLPRGAVFVKCDRGALGMAIGATMRTVFPQVFQLGSALIGVAEPVGDGLANLAANAARTPPGTLRALMERALATRGGPLPLQELARADGPVLRDDHAPVELILHRRLWDRLRE
jgi:predicted membrane-bound spermidine synthase